MGLPPSVPAPKASAHARAKALRVTLSKEQDASLRAALAYELGALTEHRLEDRAGALAVYREARQFDPQFRPALYALSRLLSDAREFDELAQTMAASVTAASLPADRASALVSLGSLFEDQLGDSAAAANSFERALAADPACLAAALMLERSLRAIGRRDAADAVTEVRTTHSFDARMRSVLACETARTQAGRGEVGRAIETLLAAVAVRGRRFSTLLALAELATEQHVPQTAARAFEDAASLLAAHAAGQPGPDSEDIAGRYADAAAAMTAAAWLYRRAGQEYLASEETAADAQRMFERACAGRTRELVLHMERADACQMGGELAGARTSLEALLEHAPPPRAAALQFRLADLAQHAGDVHEASERLRAGLALDPASPVLRAAYEDALIDRAALPALASYLGERAEQSHGPDTTTALLRAAAAAEAAGDSPRALAAMRRAAETGEPDPLLLRELYGLALRANDRAAIRDACDRLLGSDSIQPSERSAIVRSRYDASLAEGDYPHALAVLGQALKDPTCEDWAGHSAWVLAALRGDFTLLAAAHEALAEQASEPDLEAAHVAAAGRAYLRSGASDRALACFRRVLELSPTDAYAVAALEGLLVARNEAGEALRLLRDTASAERDQQRAELALLHAGAAALAAGRTDLAARSYEDAAEQNPDSLAPGWARLRLAEKSQDIALGTRALRALAERETRFGQPGIAQLELAERLDVLGEWRHALSALTAAFEGEHVGYEAAASALLAARGSDEGSDPRALRVLALGMLAQHANAGVRPAIEHEQVAELLYDAPADARTLLIARTEHAPLGFGDELLAFLLSDDAATRARTLANLARLDPEPAARAELGLHALRTQTLHAVGTDDVLVSSLALVEEAPEALGAAVALSEALTDQDAAELRASALTARARHTPGASAKSLRRELLRAYLEADRAADALALARELREEDPLDLGAWDAQREAARRTGAHALLVEACDELAKHCEGVHRARLLEEAAATLHEALHDAGAAEARLREALAADPARASLFERLHDLLLEQGDLPGLTNVLTARIAVSTSAEEKLDLSYAKARILRALGQRPEALDCLRDVLAGDPLHAGALSLAAEIHASNQAWDAAVTALDALARSDVAPAQRRLAREGAADFLEHKLKDPAAAYQRLAALAQDGYADLAVFTRMADVASRAGMHEQCATSLSQAAAHSSGPNRASFERRAAIVYAQLLNKPAEARDALRRALAADPLDIEALEALAAAAEPNEPELTSSEMFLHELWSALRAEPSDPKLLRNLARGGRLRSDKTLEYLALNALCALGLAHGDEHTALANVRKALPPLPFSAISDPQFALLGGPTHAHAAFRVARLVCRAGFDLAVPRPGTGRRTRLADTLEIFHVVSRAAAVFGLSLVELHRGEADGREVVVWSKGAGQVSVLLGPDLDLPLPASARFSLGAQCAGLRFGVLPLIQSDRGVARDLLFAALCMFPNAPQPMDAARLRPLATELSRKLSRKERRELEAAIAELPEPLPALTEIAEDARAGAYRAGMLIAQDLAPALRHVFGDDFTLETLVNSKLGLRLLRFWTSQTCLALLRSIGVTT